jgi:hypothetical protein
VFLQKMREEADEGVMFLFVAQNYGNSVEYILRPILKNWRRASGDFSKTEKQPKKFSLGRLEVLDGRARQAVCFLAL